MSDSSRKLRTSDWAHRFLVLTFGLSFLAAPVLADAGYRSGVREAWEQSMREAQRARTAGDLSRAEAHYRQAIERAEPFGPGNVRLARALDALADLYREQQRYDEAEPLYARSLVIWDRLFGPDQPRAALTMHNLAAVYLAQQKYEKAAPLFHSAQQIWEKSLGPNSIEVAISLEAQAACLQRQERWQEAEPLLERARSIRGGRSGNDR